MSKQITYTKEQLQDLLIKKLEIIEQLREENNMLNEKNSLQQQYINATNENCDKLSKVVENQALLIINLRTELEELRLSSERRSERSGGGSSPSPDHHRRRASAAAVSPALSAVSGRQNNDSPSSNDSHQSRVLFRRASSFSLDERPVFKF
jgi:hypothetical protein